MSDRFVRLAGVLLVAAALSACSSIRKMMDPANIEYRGAGEGPVLDVPPDLVAPQSNERYNLPNRGESTQTLSDFNRTRAAAGDASPTSSNVLPTRDGAKIQRDGNLHWIVINQPAEKVWPVLRDFWASQGFALAIDSAATGVMETEWAERRQRVETTGIRGILSRTLGSSYSTGERDRYRTRIERGDNGSTEIYLTHRGMEEEVIGVQKDQSVWQARPSDPELEIEYLRRLFTQFGTPREDVTLAAGPAGAAGAPGQAGATAVPEHTRIIKDGELSSLRIDEGFDRAWREVGLVLDRVGFTVEDRDRSKGVYFVRYVDLDRRDPRQGAISRFFSGTRKDLMGQRYQIVVVGKDAEATVAVREESGQPPSSPENRNVANRIITLLHEEMK